MDSQITPYSSIAEQGVLGSLLLDPDQYMDEYAPIIIPEWFYDPRHQKIYSLILELYSQSIPIDKVTVLTKLPNTPDWIEYIDILYRFVPTSHNIKAYKDELFDKFSKRRIIQTLSDTIKKSYQDQCDSDRLLDEIETNILNLKVKTKDFEIVSMKDNCLKAIDYIQDAALNKSGISGLSTGYGRLDRMINGLQKSEMIVLAARPSMGKTALATNIIENVAIKLKKAVVFFSLEMSSQQITSRLISSVSEIPNEKIRSGMCSKDDLEKITSSSRDILADAPIILDDTGGVNINYIRSMSRRYKGSHNIELIVIDYLQLIAGTSKSRKGNRENEIADVSRGVKALAKDLDVPVLVLAQLNRMSENRPCGKPKLSDIRESGSIEQDADIVMGLYRPEVYEKNEDDKEKKEGVADLLILKQRNGPIGDVPLFFNKKLTKFYELN